MEFERAFGSSPEETLRALEQAAAEYDRATRHLPSRRGVPGYAIWGSVDDLGMSCGFAEFRGRLEPAAAGSRLQGRVSLARNFKVARLAVPAVTLGLYRPALFPPDVVTPFILAALAGLVYVGFVFAPGRMRRDAERLRAWISAR